MSIVLSEELVPESLLGHQRTALIAVDEEGTISSFNRAATSLVGIDPNNFIEVRLSEIVGTTELDRWLKDATLNSSHHLDTKVPLDVKCLHDRNGMKVIAVVDAVRRLDLTTQTADYERSLTSNFSDWDSKTRSLSLLKFLQDYVEDPPSTSGMFEMIRRTGQILFPNGGVVYLKEEDDFYVQREAWGPSFSLTTFPTMTCQTSNHGQVDCLHFLSGCNGHCYEIDGHLLSLRTEGDSELDEPLAQIFAQTIRVGLLNLD